MRKKGKKKSFKKGFIGVSCASNQHGNSNISLATREQCALAIIDKLIPIGLMALSTNLQGLLTSIKKRVDDNNGNENSAFNSSYPIISKNTDAIALISSVLEEGQGLYKTDRVLHDLNQCDRNSSPLIELKSNKSVVCKRSSDKKITLADRAELRAFQRKSLTTFDFVAIALGEITIDGRTAVIAVGTTIKGDRMIIDVTDRSAENSKEMTCFLHSLVSRGLSTNHGLLVTIDGGHGLKTATESAFKKKAMIQRCTSNRIAEVTCYLSRGFQMSYRKRLKDAYRCEMYQDALRKLNVILEDLEDLNLTASSKLKKGLNETITLHRLEGSKLLRTSLGTNACIRSIQLKVNKLRLKFTKGPRDLKLRWIFSCLKAIELDLNKVRGHQTLPSLRAALSKELTLSTKDEM